MGTATGANCKKLDIKAYGITDRNGLDPIWEEVFVFDVADPDNDKFKVSLFFGETQIGLTAEYSLTGLIKMKLKYRGMAVPGGKVDLMLRPLDFGPEQEEEEDDMSFMDML